MQAPTLLASNPGMAVWQGIRTRSQRLAARCPPFEQCLVLAWAGLTLGMALALAAVHWHRPAARPQAPAPLASACQPACAPGQACTLAQWCQDFLCGQQALRQAQQLGQQAQALAAQQALARINQALNTYYEKDVAACLWRGGRPPDSGAD